MAMMPSEVLEQAAREGKSIRQVINELHPEKSDADRALLAKVVVANALLALFESGATPAQIREAIGAGR